MRARAFAAAAGLLVSVAALAAQDPAPPPGQGQTPTFRGSVDAVSVDVIVTDKQGRSITDLKVEDFEIVENKKPQAIQTFKLIKIDDTAQPDSSFVHDISSLDEQQRETARDDTRVIVIFLDDYHVRVGNSMVIRPELAKFVSQLTPHDLVAVMYPLMSVNSLTFTRNHDETASAMMRFQGRKYNYMPTNPYEAQYSEYPPEAQEMLRRQIVITALRGLATYLGTLRDGKKQVLFVSEGFNGTLPAGVRTFGGTRTSAGPPVSETERFFNQAEVLQEMERIFGAAARSNTSFYTLDPRGLAVFDNTVVDNVTATEDRTMLNEAQDSLRILAANTDGRAIVNRNQPLPELRRMLADTSSYYLLGYTSSEQWRDGKFHEIQVRVKRKDVEVRSRKGYWAYTADDVARATAPSRPSTPPAVEEALNSLAVSRSHAVQAWAAAQRAADGRAVVTFAWEPIGSGAAAASSRVDPSDVVDHVVLTATTLQGDVLFRGPVPRDPQSPTPAGRMAFDAPPGPVRLAFVAENARSLRLDHDDTSVDVPDFASTGPMITTPVVYRGRTVRDLQQVRAAASPVPAVTRAFSRTERLLIRFQAYGPGGSTPALTVRLLNNQGKPMATFPPPTRLPDGTFEVELGLGPLAPADYLIEITADGEAAKTPTLVAIKVTG